MKGLLSGGALFYQEGIGIMRSKKIYIAIYLFLLPAVVVFLMFYLAPIVTVFATSFTKWDGYNSPQFIGMKNYIKLFSNEEFYISLKNILLWSLIASVLHVGFGTLIALILYKKPFGWRFVRSVFMIPNVVSLAAWAVIYKFFFNNDFGFLNNLIRFLNPDFNVNWFFESPYAFWAITLTWLFYAVYVTLVILTDLMAIPTEIHEAALIDGASPLRITLHIDIPLVRNAIGTGVILSITSRIAMYEAIALTTRGGPGSDTMNIPLILVNAISDMRYGYANAASVIMILLGIITLIVVEKVFRMKEETY